MITLSYRVVGLTVCLFCIAATSAAQNWPQWRGANRDGVVTGFVTPERWPSKLRLDWEVDVGDGIDATPALVDDRLYVFAGQGESESLVCLDARDGSEIWRDTYETIAVKGAARSHAGPRSSPAVASGKVVALGVGGVLSCFRSSTGELLWRKTEFPDDFPAYYAASSPMILDGLCIAQLGGKETGAVVAYDLASGAERWRWEGDPPAYASPVAMNVSDSTQIVLLTEENLVGISAADGNLLWQTPFPVPRMSTNSATPVVHGQMVIYSAQKRGTRAVRIERDADRFRVEEVWRNEDLSTAFNTPVLKDEHLYGLAESGKLYCLDTRNGAVTWTADARHERFGAIVSAGSTLFALPSGGPLIVYEANPIEYAELTRYPISDTPIYAYPVIARSRVYIQDQETLTAWSFE